MFIYYNPNPKLNRVGDCVIRAICRVTDQPWEKVYSDVCFEGLCQYDMPSSNAVWGEYLQKNGFKRMSIPNSCPQCITVKEFCKAFQQGVYVIGTGTHVVGIVNEDYFDTWDSGDEVVAYYFKKEK